MTEGEVCIPAEGAPPPRSQTGGGGGGSRLSAITRPPVTARSVGEGVSISAGMSSGPQAPPGLGIYDGGVMV